MRIRQPKRFVSIGGWMFVLGMLWYGYAIVREPLEQYQHYDPYSSTAMTVSGIMDVSYDRVLPGGQTVRIDNRHAMFVADVKDDDFSERLYPTFAAAIAEGRRLGLPLLPSISMIHHRLRAADIALVTEVQFEVQRDLVVLLRDLDRALAVTTSSSISRIQVDSARAFIGAARMLAADEADHSNRDPDLRRNIGTLLDRFRSGERSAGRGFNESVVPARYARTPERERLFETQRFLMGALSHDALAAMVHVLENNPECLRRLGRLNSVYSALDNPPETRHLLDVVNEGAPSGKSAAPHIVSRVPGVYFLPTAVSPETDYFYRRDGFAAATSRNQPNWMEEVVSAIRSGRIDTTPTSASGWYDYKVHALVPLIRADHALGVGTRKLRATPAYLQFMEETFRSALAGTRETHVLRLEPMYLGILPDRETIIELAPHFSCEPEPAVYERLSRGYAFLKQRLHEQSHFASAVRCGELQSLTRNLAAVSFLEAGIPPDGHTAQEFTSNELRRRGAEAESWLASLPDDPVFAEDPRTLQAVAPERKWANVGVRFKRLHYEYDAEPDVDGKGVIVRPADYYAPMLVAAEINQDLTEEQLLRVCDRSRSVSDCLIRLGASPASPSSDRIAVFSVLKTITAALLIIVGWNIALLFRPPPVVHLRRKRSVRSRLVMAMVGIAILPMLTILAPAVLTYHVLPRFELSPWYVAQLSQAFLWHLPASPRLAQEDTPVHRVMRTVVDHVLGQALRSDSPSVRENALNCWPAASDMGPRATMALYEIGLTRGYSETELAVTALQQQWWRAKGSGQAQAICERIRPILERFSWNPRLVLRCSQLIRHARISEFTDHLEAALFQASPADQNIPGAVCALLAASALTLPYDRMVELNLLPPDPERVTAESVPIPAALDGLGRRLREIAYTAGKSSIRDRYHETVTDTMEHDDYIRAWQDTRVADLMLALNRCQECLPYWTLCELEDMSPAQRSRFFSLAVPWLASEHPPNESLNPRLRILNYLSRAGSAWHYRDSDYDIALRAIIDSGRWEEVPLTQSRSGDGSDEPTEMWGNELRDILTKRAERPPVQDVSSFGEL